MPKQGIARLFLLAAGLAQVSRCPASLCGFPVKPPHDKILRQPLLARCIHKVRYGTVLCYWSSSQVVLPSPGSSGNRGMHLAQALLPAGDTHAIAHCSCLVLAGLQHGTALCRSNVPQAASLCGCWLLPAASVQQPSAPGHHSMSYQNPETLLCAGRHDWRDATAARGGRQRRAARCAGNGCRAGRRGAHQHMSAYVGAAESGTMPDCFHELDTVCAA